MPDIGNVDLRSKVTDKYAKLLHDSVSFDVVLDVQGEKINAHRLILAVHSIFFRILMLGQEFKESASSEVILEAPVAAFKMLMHYMYTGTIDLRKYSISDVADLYEISHRYGVVELENAVTTYLCFAIDAKNACKVLQIASLTEADDLEDRCLLQIRATIEGFNAVDLNLTFEMFKFIMEKHFSFRIEVKWIQALHELILKPGFCTESQKNELVKLIDWSKISFKDLIDIIKPTGLLNDSDLIQLIESQSFHNESVCDIFSLSDEMSFIKADENDVNICMIVDLKNIFRFNYILLQLDNGYKYKYCIETSKNLKNWMQVIDFSESWCCDEQDLYFAETVARYIKVIVVETTHKTDNISEFTKLNVRHIEDLPLQLGGFVIPAVNVITAANARVYKSINKIHGRSKYLQSSKVLDSGFEDNGTNTSYVSAVIGEETLTIRFNQPYLLNFFAFRLWDYDGQKYAYKVSTALNSTDDFEMIRDKSDELLDGWQLIDFSLREVAVIRIEGVKSNIGHEIRITHFQ